MKKSIAAAGALVGAMLFTGVSQAESFQDHINSCVEKFASNKLTANVALECTAAGGKLSDCKVVENSMPGKGFDKAALCLADFLPMGSRTGTVHVPLKFQAS